MFYSLLYFQCPSKHSCYYCYRSPPLLLILYVVVMNRTSQNNFYVIRFNYQNLRISDVSPPQIRYITIKTVNRNQYKKLLTHRAWLVIKARCRPFPPDVYNRRWILMVVNVKHCLNDINGCWCEALCGRY